jgi:hypothetical protein
MMKRMKDMRDMVHAAPDMIAQAQQLGAQAQQMAAAQQAAAQAQLAGAQQMGQFGGLPGAQPVADATGPDFDAIAGVSLEDYAAVNKGISGDSSKLQEVLASRGVPAGNWDEASRGWQARMQANPFVTKRYNQLWREA